MVGDELAQLHTLNLPTELPAGAYYLQIGLYSEETLERLQIPIGESYKAEKLILEQVMIKSD
jgi:hypothetical protein